MVWLLLSGAALAGLSFLVMKQRTQTLPRISNVEFLHLYKVRFDDPEEFVLNERDRIARHLGLPADVLTPNQTFEKLSQFSGFVGEFELGMGDLETTLWELFRKTNLEQPNPFPATVGELIHGIVLARTLM